MNLAKTKTVKSSRCFAVGSSKTTGNGQSQSHVEVQLAKFDQVFLTTPLAVKKNNLRW